MVSRLLAGLVVGLGAAVPAAAQVVSGSYGPVHLTVGAERVAGVYDERIGVGASAIACVFLFEGPIAGGDGAVRAWLPGVPETSTGTLRGDGDGSVHIRLDESMPGCPMAAGDLTREGQSLPLARAHPEWIDLGVVVGEVARLREGRNAGDGALEALDQYDAVAVLERQGDLLLVERLGREITLRGWTDRASIATASDPSN